MTSPYNLLLLLFLILPTPTSATRDLINQTCKNSSKEYPNIEYNFCMHALRAFPASRCASLTRLALISITLVKNNVTDTRCMVKRFLKDKKQEKDTKEALKDCMELYSDSNSTLSDAYTDFEASRFFEANVKVSSVMDASTTCELGFEDLGLFSPLKVENDHIFQLSAISLSIINTNLFHSTNQ